MAPNALLFVTAGLLGGCDDCSRTIVFDVTVVSGGAPISGASIAAACQEVGGTPRAGQGTSGSDGKSLFRVVAPSRSCPAEPTRIASYFGSCTLTTTASGRPPLVRTLTGDELDALHPPENWPDGNGVILTLDLSGT